MVDPHAKEKLVFPELFPDDYDFIDSDEKEPEITEEMIKNGY